MSERKPACLTLEDFGFIYPAGDRPALDAVSLELSRGSFFVLCGPSGCGKSTLLRSCKTALAPHGTRTGRILLAGTPLPDLSPAEQSRRVGFVGQSAENQLVTDKVWHELAFGAESLGWSSDVIRRRVAETATFFGIQNWFYRDTASLSGGQKQLLNLAAVMVTEPELLILDEPTSQLDPIAASELLQTLARLNRELGVTVLLTEHRLEEALSLADTAAVLDEGRLLCVGTPTAVGEALKSAGHGMFLAMPTAMRVWAAAKSDAPCPVTVRQGRDWLTGFAGDHDLLPLPPEPARNPGADTVLEARGLWFRYEQGGPDVLRGLDLTVKKGEWVALLGGNGAGKTTLLKLLAGQKTPWRGSVTASGRVGLLPQDPQTLFVKKTVREDLAELLGKKPDEAARRRLERLTDLCRLGPLLHRHPYDLSGGEQQRCALAKVLLAEPELLLLDEPTKGLDAEFKQQLAAILEQLIAGGVAVVMVSHDVEFCARFAHRCALVFDGAVTAAGTPRDFFAGNRFYTTGANRMARELLPRAVTAEDLIAACGGEPPPAPALPEAGKTPPLPAADTAPEKAPPLPAWRKLLAVLAGLTALAAAVRAASVTDLSALVTVAGVTALGADQWACILTVIAALAVLALAVSRREDRRALPPPERRRLGRRTVLAAALVLLLIPLTLLLGQGLLRGRRYYFIALLILLECMTPFFLVFEGRRPQARELTVIAVLCAIGVAGRAAFFMLPQFKPVLALTVIAGAALGGETGFLVGAVTMLTSNVLFGQTPLTPWQMFAMGLAGFLAGVLFFRGRLRRTRLTLCVFGSLAALLYGGIMNPAAALTASAELNGPTLLTYYLTGFPLDCVHAAATWLFLWFGAEPFLEKLERVRVKYGLLE